MLTKSFLFLTPGQMYCTTLKVTHSNIGRWCSIGCCNMSPTEWGRKMERLHSKTSNPCWIMDDKQKYKFSKLKNLHYWALGNFEVEFSAVSKRRVMLWYWMYCILYTDYMSHEKSSTGKMTTHVLISYISCRVAANIYYFNRIWTLANIVKSNQ